MPSLRATFRLITLVLSTFGMFLIYIIGQGIVRLFSWTYAGWQNFMIGVWSGWAIGLVGMRLHVEGSPPKPPFFLVSNHLSYVDVLALFKLTDAVFVAKKELKTWPVIGFMARTLGIIFIDRENIRDIPRVNRLISEYISDQQGIILFPEGTSSPGSGVLPFKPSLLHYPAEKRMGVSYAAIRYQSNTDGNPAYNHICWWGDMTFADHFFNLLKLKSFDAYVTFGSKIIVNDDRKILAIRLRQLVEDLFKPVYINRDEENE